MSDKALKTQGTKIAVGDGASPEVFTDIGDIEGWSGLDGQVTEIDVTDLDSTSKEFIMGLKEEGSFQVDLNWIPANAEQVSLRADMNAGTKRNFKVTGTDSPATVIIFAAFVTQFSMSGTKDDKVTASITLRITGAVTIT